LIKRVCERSIATIPRISHKYFIILHTLILLGFIKVTTIFGFLGKKLLQMHVLVAIIIVVGKTIKAYVRYIYYIQGETQNHSCLC
jgi:hypothetical protein